MYGGEEQSRARKGGAGVQQGRKQTSEEYGRAGKGRAGHDNIGEGRA